MKTLFRWMLMSLVVPACSAPPVVVPKPVEKPDVDNWPPRPQVSGQVQAHFPNPTLVPIRKTAAGAGVTAVVVERHELPLVHLRWVIPGGRMLAWTGTANRWPTGTLNFAQDVAMMGTKAHPGTAFAAAVADLGASLSAHALGDAVVVEAQVLSHQFTKLMPLLRELVLEPAFDKADIETTRRKLAAQLQAEAGDPEAISARLALDLAFSPNHPYAADTPTAQSLPLIQRKQLLEAWTAATRLGGSTVAVVGDIEPAALAQAIEREFGAAIETIPWVPTVVLPQPATIDTCHVVAVDGAVQIAMHQVVPGPPRRTKQWPALIVANQILGGSASSRLFNELREKRGYTYGIYSGFDARRTAGRWSLQGNVRNAVLGDALTAIDDVLQGARRQGPTDRELDEAKRYLSGQFALALASGDSLVEYLAAVPLYGLAADEFLNYNQALQAVSADQVLEATLASIPAVGRVTVLVGDYASTRPGLDAACRQIIEHDTTGHVLRVLLGTDMEMGDTGRSEAFAAWQKAPAGLVAAARYVAQAERSPQFRADILALIARGPAADKVLTMGRASADWQASLAPALASRLLAALRDPELAVQKRAHALVLAMANSTGADSKRPDTNAEESKALRDAVATWAFADVDGTKTPDQVLALAEARLDEGDLILLGDSCGEVLEHWLANNVRRHEAADALLRFKNAANTRALVRGYRRFYQYGVPPVQADLDALGHVQGVESLALLLDVHAMQQGLDMPHALTRTAGLMKTARDLLKQLAGQNAADGGEGTELSARFDRVESHMENLLVMRNADDRWLAAGLLTRYRGVSGLRRVLAGLKDDGNYRTPRWRTVDPKRMVALLARDDIAPLGADAEPALMAALSATKPIGKVVAVIGLKALNSAGALAALRTSTDETDVSAYLELPTAFTVRDLALASVDVMRMARDVDKQVAAGKMSKESAAIYRDVSFFITELADKRLREEVHRQVLERTAALAPPADVTPTNAPEGGPQPKP